MTRLWVVIIALLFVTCGVVYQNAYLMEKNERLAGLGGEAHLTVHNLNHLIFKLNRDSVACNELVDRMIEADGRMVERKR